MIRSLPFGLTALSIVLLVLPLTAHQPGQPPVLKADEPAYYLAALSLAYDGDLVVEDQDRERLFEGFPYLPVQNLIVMSDDGWRTLYFGKPYLYSLLAAPFAGLFGARGLVAFNMLLFVAMVWMASAWLRRENPAWVADSFAVAFFFASLGWVYVYWLHPEVFNMCAGAACLFFGLSAVRAGRADVGASLHRFFASPWALVVSASALAAGVYNKPMLAALGLPVVFELLRKRRWRGLGVWLLSAAVSVLVFSGVSVLLTGKPTAYLVDLRAGYPVHDPFAPMVPLAQVEAAQRAAAEASAAKAAAQQAAASDDTASDDRASESSVADTEEKRATGAGWWWLLRIPEVKGFELAEDIPYFFLGRHTGLLLYGPFALLAFVLFVLHGWRRFEGWSVLASAALIGAFFVVFIPFNWHGGGGFVGNRYFVMAYPAFLFLVTRVAPAWLLIPGSVVAGLFLGPLLISPNGLAVPQGTLQAHVRDAPFVPFPVEHSLAEIPGYVGQVQSGLWLWGRKDQLRPMEDELWLLGNSRVELWIQSVKPLSRLEIELTSPMAHNRATLELVEEKRQVVLGAEPLRLGFELDQPTLLRHDRSRQNYQEFVYIWVYLLQVDLERGRLPIWRGQPGPTFYQGAALRVLEVERTESDLSVTVGSNVSE